MHGLAALAVKEAAVAAGMNLLRGIAPSAIVGFTAGIVFSGSCLALVAAPRRALMRRAAPAHAQGAAFPVHPAISPFDESAEMVVPAGIEPLSAAFGLLQSGHAGLTGQRRTHKSPDASAAHWRLVMKRSTARHAAPAGSIGRRLAGAVPLHVVAVRH